MKYAEMLPRQIDKLIADKVMGELMCNGEVTPMRMSSGWQCLECGAFGIGDGPTGPHEVPDRRVPAYSTDMNAAWLIVEKLRSQQLDVSLYTGRGDTDPYFVQVWNRPFHDLKSCGSSNDSMSDAICEAALKACGVKIEQ